MTLDLALSITPRERRPRSAASRDADARRSHGHRAAGPVRRRRSSAIRSNSAPRESLRKELVFVIRHAGGGLSDRDHDFALEVTDRLSGQTVSFALPAEYRG